MLLAVVISIIHLEGIWGIIGGRPARDYPFFAVVHSGDHICGGTVLSRKVVLTAAHCLYHETKNRWASALEVYVLHGDVSSAENLMLRYHSCEKFVAHFRYDPSQHEGRGPFDVAVIKLEDEVRIQKSREPTMISPCRICCNRWRKHQSGVAIGFGSNYGKLMELSIVKTPCDSCKFLPENLFDPVQLCYKSPKGSSLNMNDFGGPLVLKEGGNSRCLIGVSSFTIHLEHSYSTNVFTSAGMLRYWLKRVYKENFTHVSFNMDYSYG